jgi:hypothetical protein
VRGHAENQFLKDDLERLLLSSKEGTPTEVINGIRDLGMGHETGEALLDNHPEFFAYQAALTRTFAEMVHAQDIAEIGQMLGDDLHGAASFGQIAAEKNNIYPLSGKGIINTRLRDLCGETWDLRQSWFLATPQRGWRGIYASALRRWLGRTAHQGHVSATVHASGLSPGLPFPSMTRNGYTPKSATQSGE